MVIRNVTRADDAELCRNSTQISLTIIRVVGFVVQDKLIIHEVKGVGARLEWMSDHLVDEIWRQRGKLVDVLASIFRVRNAVAEVEVESFQQAILEEMALNHSEVFHVFVADLKFHAENGK